MSRIGRESFVSEMSSGLDTNNLSPEAQAALKKAGIDQGKLAAIAGQDGVIKGQDELDALFTLIDTKDSNGSYHSIDHTNERRGDGQRPAVRGAEGRARAGAAGGAGGGGDEAGTRRTGAAGQLAISPIPQPNTKREWLHSGTRVSRTSTSRRTPPTSTRRTTRGLTTLSKVNEKDSTRTIKEAGCAPTALAIADATLRGGDTTPGHSKFAVDRSTADNSRAPAPTPTPWHGTGPRSTA